MERFLGAPLRPVPSSISASGMESGQPGLPAEFRHGRHTIRIRQVLRTWRETGPCSHGSGERYLRKHWFEIETDQGERLKIYFCRQPSRGGGKTRWWLYSASGAPGG